MEPLNETPSLNQQDDSTLNGMPEKMRVIVRDLNRLMDDYQNTLNSLKKAYNYASKQALEIWENEKKQIESEKASNNETLKSNEAEGNRLQLDIERKNESALSHIRKNHVYPNASLNLSPLLPSKDTNALDNARYQLSAIDHRLSDLTKRGKPQSLGAMVFGFVAVGFVISICAAVAGASRGEDGLPAFFLVNFLFTGVGIALAIVRVVISTSDIRLHYDHVLTEIKKAEEYVKMFREQSAEYHRDTETKLHEHLRKANTKYKNTISDEDSSYQASLENHNDKTAIKVNDATSICESFYKETGFAGLGWNEEKWSEWNNVNSPLFSSCVGYLVSPIFDFKVPAMLSFNEGKDGRCLLLKATGQQKEQSNKAVQSVMLRLMANVPSGKVLFTLIDPIGLGQNVASFMPLADFEEKLITSRAWTEPKHIEEQLSKLTEHMENVIQKYLRNDYATIEEYNQKAGEVAEPYRVLVVFDFPNNFTEDTARRLLSIARNGPRCGVYTLVVMDTDSSQKLPYGFNIAELEHSANVIYSEENSFVWADYDIKRYKVNLDEPPAAELFNRIIKQTGEHAKDAMKVEVPFDKLLSLAGINESNFWQEDHYSTKEMIHVPLGPKGAQKLQYLTFGKGTEHHAVVIGMPGSGKSNLMHIIVTSMAMMYSPEEIQLYLVDFKQGVEFKRYAEAKLPHAKVIAIESEREFGMSVLKGLDKELYDRGETFRKLDVNSISDYRNKTNEPMPRILLLVDEFQEFFSYDDNIGREAGLLLDRLIRQGRYAGVHVMLGSQSLGNRSLPNSTLGQVGIRIALKCSESDARQIMADDNPQARLLSRPGEAIYNAASGLIEGNNFFQVALFTEDDRQRRLDEISRFATNIESQKNKSFERPIIFEGNEPSRLEECAPLKQLLAQKEYTEMKKVKDLWLGEPVAILPPTSAKLRPQGANNLLIVTRNEEEGIAMLTAAILSLAAQAHPANAKFFIVDLSTADTSWEYVAEDLANLLPHQIEVLGRRDFAGTLKDLVAELNRRIEGGKGEDVYFVIQGLHRARDLREEEPRFRSRLSDEEQELSVPELFAKLLREGSECGIHVLAWCDAYSNVKKSLGRSVNEFALRVAGAMSNDDSMGLIDDSVASKLDKPHRAIFFDDERPGHLEKFRPYTIPEKNWLEQIGQILRARVSKHQSLAGD